MKSQAKKVYVAMSGGVDSSVAAALLKKQGFDVVGVFMKPYQPDVGICLWQKDRKDAMRVASILNIPLLTWDFSKEYKKEVTDYMIREYRAGRTPNPDVMCNKHIKFGLFLDKALKEGADYIATGHYVVKRETYNLKRKNHASRFTLHASRDKNKNQSYFLWTLNHDQLKYCFFPIGEYIKPEVRKLAKKFGLPTHDKKDSQGVCFIGPLNMKDFLTKYIKPRIGKIIDQGGKVIGTHDGVYYYTLGQRHGLDIKNGQGPYYVVKKDVAKNIIVVAKSDNDTDFRVREAQLTNVNFINQNFHSHILKNMRMGGEKVLVRVRYRQPLVKAKLVYKNKSVRLIFEKPQKAVTPGQSAVFYRRNELIGGGVIK